MILSVVLCCDDVIKSLVSSQFVSGAHDIEQNFTITLDSVDRTFHKSSNELLSLPLRDHP